MEVAEEPEEPALEPEPEPRELDPEAPEPEPEPLVEEEPAEPVREEVPVTIAVPLETKVPLFPPMMVPFCPLTMVPFCPPMIVPFCPMTTGVVPLIKAVPLLATIGAVELATVVLLTIAGAEVALAIADDATPEGLKRYDLTSEGRAAIQEGVELAANSDSTDEITPALLVKY